MGGGCGCEMASGTTELVYTRRGTKNAKILQSAKELLWLSLIAFFILFFHFFFVLLFMFHDWVEQGNTDYWGLYERYVVGVRDTELEWSSYDS